jgi:hypothetical protein
MTGMKDRWLQHRLEASWPGVRLISGFYRACTVAISIRTHHHAESDHVTIVVIARNGFVQVVMSQNMLEAAQSRDLELKAIRWIEQRYPDMHAPPRLASDESP